MTSRHARLLFWLALVVVSAGLMPTKGLAAGASLAISPGSIKTEAGKTFSVSVVLNAGEPINAASGTVTYSGNIQATGVSQSGSILTLWTENPSISGNSITFGGGLSNPGYVGNGGRIFSITFKAVGSGGGSISISGGRALANDGRGTNVFTGASGATVTVGTPPPTLAASSISSSSHPDQSKWYKAKDLTLSWTKPGSAQSLKYSLSSPGSSVSKSETTAATSATFQNLSDGVWSFTVTITYPAGERSTTFKAQIDTVAPTDVEVKYSQKSPTDPYPTLEYSAKDAHSGIDHYEITIDGAAPVSVKETTYKLPRQVPGKKNIVVKALDKAGNSAEKSTTLVVEGFPGPVLLSVSKYVSVLQPIDVEGRGLFGAKTTVFVDGKSVGEFNVKDQLKNGPNDQAKADDELVWTYRINATLLPGTHKITANQTKEDGSESNLSNELVTRVLWSSVSVGGVIVPLVIVVLVLSLTVVALLLMLVLLWRRAKRQLPSFPLNFRRRIVNLESEIDGELSELKRQIDRTVTVLEKKPKVLRNQVTGIVDGTKQAIDRYIDKELTDLENSDGSLKKK